MASGIARPSAVRRLGQEFIRKAWPIMKASTLMDTSFCYRHSRSCRCREPVTGSESDKEFKYKYSGNIAGCTCVDWSGLGSQLGWLGDSALVFMAWLTEQTVYQRRDFLIVECVDPFDDAMLGELTKEEYEMLTLSISPEMFGFPATRRRKYMILFRKDKLRWDEKIGVEPAAAFHRLFHRPLSLAGDVFFNAPEGFVQAYMKKWARRCHMPEVQENGSCWPAKQLMTKVCRQRVRDWEQLLG